MPGKGRAMGYSDYYKNNSHTPGSDADEEEDARENGFSIKITTGTSMSSDAGKKLRQEALKRRLKKKVP